MLFHRILANCNLDTRSPFSLGQMRAMAAVTLSYHAALEGDKKTLDESDWEGYIRAASHSIKSDSLLKRASEESTPSPSPRPLAENSSRMPDPPSPATRKLWQQKTNTLLGKDAHEESKKRPLRIADPTNTRVGQDPGTAKDDDLMQERKDKYQDAFSHQVASTDRQGHGSNSSTYSSSLQ